MVSSAVNRRVEGWTLLAASALATQLYAGGARGEEELVVDVVGTPLDPSAADPTPASYRIDGESLQRAGSDLGDALARAPGVQVSRSGGAGDPVGISLRGARGAQTPVVIAGMPLNDDITGAVDLSTLPVWMLHHADVYRGHAPRWLDVLGVGGAIVLEPRLPRRPAATVGLGFGSFGWREARGALAVGDGAAASLLAVGARTSAGDFPFVDDGGTRFDPSDDVERRRDNGDVRDVDAWSLHRWSTRRMQLRVVTHVFHRDGGAPGLQLPGTRAARVDVDRALGAAALRVAPCAEGRCVVELEAGALVGRYRLDDPRRELGGAATVDNRSARRRARVRVAGQLAPGLEVGVALTQSDTHLDLDTSSPGAPRPGAERARRATWRPQVDAHLRRGSVDVVAVAAAPCQRTRATGVGGDVCGILEPTGRVGLRVAAPHRITLFANGGRYLRVPTLGETYGLSSVVLGNPDLLPETGLSAEVGVEIDGAIGALRGWAQGVGHARWVDDLVAYRRASLGGVRPFNVSRARFLGGELSAGASYDGWLEAEVALSAVDPRDLDSPLAQGRDLVPYVARLAVAPMLALVAPPWEAIALDTARLETRFRYQASRSADPAGLITLPAQALWSIDAVVSFDRTWRLRGRLDNLLDQRTSDFVGYPVPGRAGYVFGEASW